MQNTDQTIAKLNSGMTAASVQALAEVEKSFSAGMDKRIMLAQLADAGTDVVQLRGKGRADVAQSFSLYLRAIGIAPGTRLTKEEREKHSAAFHALKSTFIASQGIGRVDVHGTAADVVKLGKARLSGSDSFGLPTEAKRSLTVAYRPTVREIGDWLQEQEASLATRKAGFGKLLAAVK